MATKDKQTTERAQAEEHAAMALAHLDEADNVEAAPGTPEEQNRLARAQIHLLQAIYHELRHSNDLAACNAAALDEHANAMDHLGTDMRGLGDALSRHRG
ncbi:hypothetical protein [Amycolatopsis japonica]